MCVCQSGLRSLRLLVVCREAAATSTNCCSMHGFCLTNRNAMHKRDLCRHAVSVHPYVCLSVTFVYSVETSKHIFEIFSPLGYPCHSSFSVPNVMAIFRRTPPDEGVRCMWGRQNLRFWLHRVVNGATAKCYTHSCAGLWQVSDTHRW